MYKNEKMTVSMQTCFYKLNSIILIIIVEEKLVKNI